MYLYVYLFTCTYLYIYTLFEFHTLSPQTEEIRLKIIAAAKNVNKFSQESPYISNTFSRESPKFQTGFHVSKRTPRVIWVPVTQTSGRENCPIWTFNHCLLREWIIWNIIHVTCMAHCNTLKHTATQYNALQRAATPIARGSYMIHFTWKMHTYYDMHHTCDEYHNVYTCIF